VCAPDRGLSPRMRGHLDMVLVCVLLLGSIPADAGPPPWADGDRWRNLVYPRGCGATVIVISYKPKDWGLSPRMRGHPTLLDHSSALVRSIPADAGPP